MTLNSYDVIGEQVFSHTLENGLTVKVVPKRDYAKCFAFFAVNYGGADRRFVLDGEMTDTPMGVAHFLEHKMFDMPDGNAMNSLSENGANPNAFTSSDITAYYFQATEKFYEDLEILLKFVTTPYFTAESVQKEQGIIGQEIRMTEDEPDYAVYYGLMQCLYRSNPIRYSVAGTVESIAEITDETLYGCHKVFYNPSNMVLCCVGDIDPGRVVKMAEELLTKERAHVARADYGEKEAPEAFSDRFEAKMSVSRPLFMCGIKTQPPKNGKAFQRFELTGELAVRLIAGKSSPLFSEMYESGLITNDFSAAFESVANTAHAVFSGESDDPDAVYGKIRKEIEALINDGVDEERFERTKKALMGQKIKELNSFDDICYEQARSYFRDFDPFNAVSVLEKMTPETVREFAAKEFLNDRFAISVIEPVE